MKKIINNKFSWLIAIIIVIGIVFAYKSLSKDLYSVEISLGENVDRTSENKNQVAYWKLDNKEMGPWDYMRLSKDSSEMTVDEISEKLGKKPMISKDSKSETTNEDKQKEQVKIKNLSEGIYLFKYISKDSKQTPALVEYVGEQSAKNGVLHIDLK